eukprot:CAMPEP_0168192554 /NCGR_PEP_ID=MMETSP0139_2-20121125/18111_1 /TAXON_ID=44445 /ORGANISM="Pseudo-nitzschia australis, Strain 10249 10 AB" /LENGTH=285 /DNA_ID=CAMNT_0008115803 /DNA_START=106 /DNA_END=963 /DNA_ORIENTATION=+
MSQILSKSAKSPYKKATRIPPNAILLVSGILSFFIAFLSSRHFAATLEDTYIDSATPTVRSSGVVVIKPIASSIPVCEKTPWKESENLVGSCPGALKHNKEASSSMEDCAVACCESEKCVSWQFRRDVGCLHGGDVRLGMEKDGTSSWCSDHPPRKWEGQYVMRRANGAIVQNKDQTGGCSLDTWNPNEQPGQCFGLGDVKKTRKNDASVRIDSARSCMEACCEVEDCGAWQWQSGLGCFYHLRMHGCVDTSDPVVFEAFVGRRKLQSSRTYVDKEGNPWKQQLE